MILQPIIENAVFHGLEPTLGKGQINISAYKKSTDLYITIWDNGVGISDDKLKEITDKLSTATSYFYLDDHANKSIGLLNIHNKIRLFMGEEYGLSLINQDNKTTVIIKLDINSSKKNL